MKKAIVLIVFIICLYNSLFSHEYVFFLTKTPNIDGVLDKSINRNNLNSFSDIYKSVNDISDIDAKYFLGYNSEFLYIYIEADAEKITYRDRGYQNGDGFHLTIGRANYDNSETDEFYVLGFSPSKDWSNKMRWYYNIDLSMAILPPNVQFETLEHNGKISFELLLPWMVVKPYHPWIEDDIAFNLCFVKAVNEVDKIYYFTTLDERMQSEQSKRKYINLNFEDPTCEGELFASPTRSNIISDQKVEIEFVGYIVEKANRNASIKIFNEKNQEVFSKKLALKFDQGLSRIKKSLNDFTPNPGVYNLNIIFDTDSILEYEISVFESFDLNTVRCILNKNKSNLKRGTYNSLQFYLNELELEVNSLKYYESSREIIKQIETIKMAINLIELNKDPFNDLTGVYRRAFFSQIDSSFRPYSIYIPKDFNPINKYPLIVYLHGSGEDDRTLFKTNFIKEGFIVMAPNGRGTSNCFATIEAQTDIKEAIEDVIFNFNIDTEKIILSGFSMGGYGVYRTFYEQPETFSALAILSGHPDLARKWEYKDGINFLDDEIVTIFFDIPMFIYHSTQDLNCPYNLTEELVKKIKIGNDMVKFIVDEQKGHSVMSEGNWKLYFNWLKNIKN